MAISNHFPAGILFKATPPPMVVDVPARQLSDDHLDDFSFSMDTGVANFLLDRNESNCVAKLKCEVNDITFRSFENRSHGSRVPTVVKVETEGKVNITLIAEGKGKWISNSDESFGIQFSMPPTFKTSYTPESTSLWEQLFKLRVDIVPQEVEKVGIQIPDIKIDFGALDLFLTTNILTPGKHVFRLRSIPENLYLPWDMMLLGDVKSSG
jgi:hypothetical protein